MTREIAFFEQSSETGNTQIAMLFPGDADAFIKILWTLKDHVQNFQIENSQLVARIDEDTTVRCDLSQILGSGVSLCFKVGTDSMRDLRALSGNEDILVLETANSKELIFTNGEMAISLNKITHMEAIIVPNMNDAAIIGRAFETDKGSKIRDFAKSSSYVLLNIYQDQLGTIERPDGRIFCIGEYSLFEYQQMKPTLVLRSYSFLTVVSDEISLTITKLRDNTYNLRTRVVSGFNMILNFFERLFIEKE